MVQNDVELTRALELIKKKDFARARDILMRIDHPLAEQWLQKIMMQGTAQRTMMDGLTVESPVDLVGEDEPLISLMESRQLGMGALIASLIGLIAVVGLGALGGIALYGLKTYVDYQLLIFPLVAISLTAALFRIVMSVFQIKRRSVLVFLALMLGAMTYGTYWYLQYDEFLQLTGAETSTLFGTGDELTLADQVLLDMTGESGMVGFVLFSADEGQRVSRNQAIEFFDEFTPRMDRDTSLIYWGAELLILIILPLLVIVNLQQQRRQFQL